MDGRYEATTAQRKAHIRRMYAKYQGKKINENNELKEYIKLPLERWGTPEDIGAAVLYMVSPASGWVTGQCLYVTGGS